MRNLLGLAFLLTTALAVWAGDWPTTGGSASRGNYTSEELPAKLGLHWTYKASHAPMPAWPRSDRQPYDRVFHTVSAGGKVFFGSSADGKVYALDAATGKEAWTYHTGGPVRFAPAIWKDRLFVASDDGYLHCLAVADGKLLWQKRGGPDGRMILGNDQMVSRWPARGGPAVEGDTVYFAAGIWPTDGIYLYALEAETGKVKWVNDKAGELYLAQPHGGANAHSGVSAQGDLVVSDNRLLVPTGRAVPAAFNRADGKFQYFLLQLNGKKGGTTTIGAGSVFVNGGSLFETTTGTLVEPVGPGAVAVSPEGLLHSSPTALTFSKLTDKEKVDRKGEKIKYKGMVADWTTKIAGGSAALIAGKRAVIAGPGKITVVEMAAHKVVWSAEVEGDPLGLAVAEGRLLVSTDRGQIHCFGTARQEKPTVIQRTPETSSDDKAVAAAKEVVEKSGVTEGYCVDLGCGDGSFALELARRTKLQICAVDADPKKVAEARRKLDAAGLYGVRVTVHLADPAKTLYPRHFADLVVSARALGDGTDAVSPEEVNRLQRPSGGITCLGKSGELKKKTRGNLEGAGNWTHLYADPANTCCSDDIVVRGNLGMLWFRDSDFEMPQRHGRGPAPLYLDGRLFVEGLNGIRAVNAYNGRTLWEYSIPGVLKSYDADHLMGVSGTHGTWCVSPDGVYVKTGDKCLRIDPATGKKLAEFEMPRPADKKECYWGYIAVEGDTLYGSVADDSHVVKFPYQKGDMTKQFTESVMFFALDAKTGKERWKFTPKHSIRHNAIAIGGGRVYLIDPPIAAKDRLDAPKADPREHEKGELIALDAKTGKVAWKGKEEVYGTLLTLSVKHEVLVMGYSPTRFKLPSEVGGRLAAYKTSDGKRLWDVESAYDTRPLINDRTVYAMAGKQGGAWDLVTGEAKKFGVNRSYGCGQLASGAHLMVFRSATLSYFDLASSKEVENYGGIRPGCWINAIPAGGIVLVPDASAGCQCSYLNQAWIALQGSE